jgi:hypothetical protein
VWAGVLFVAVKAFDLAGGRGDGAGAGTPAAAAGIE